MWTRARDGVVLPETTSEAIKRLNRGLPWQDWGGIRMSIDRCHFVLPTGKPVLRSTIRRVMGQMDQPIRLLSSYLSIPNGQVKNFLNACRAVPLHMPLVRVAVIGSKAAEGGGRWHKYFALYLARRCKHVIVDFYDYAEREDMWVKQLEGSFISCEWIAEGVTVAGLSASSYDVIVDDVWTHETGPSLPGVTQVPLQAFSWKGGKQETARFVPFLHPSETRCFSHPPLRNVQAGCQCLVCRECKACSDDYEDYLFLRHMCSRLGHEAPCVGVSFTEELRLVDDFLRQLLSQPQVTLRKASYFRAAMAVSEEIALDIKGLMVRQAHDIEPQFRSYQRTDHHVGAFEKNSYPWLEGKAVFFSGVPSTVLGTTKVRRVQSYQSPDQCDAVFCSSFDVWRQQFISNVVYTPYCGAEVRERFPDWEWTGRQVLTFREYVRRKDVQETASVQEKPHQICAKLMYPPWGLFPYTDVSLHGDYVRDRGDYMKGAKFFSLKRKGAFISLVPFNPEQWSSSIWVRCHDWGPIMEGLHDVGPVFGFMNAAIPLPWNIDPDQLLEIEKRYCGDAQQILRRYYYDKDEEFAWSQRVQVEGQLMTLRQYLSIQVEFVFTEVTKYEHLPRQPRSIRLSRNVMSHVSAAFPYETDWFLEWQERKQNYSLFTQFVQARERANKLKLPQYRM